MIDGRFPADVDEATDDLAEQLLDAASHVLRSMSSVGETSM